MIKWFHEYNNLPKNNWERGNNEKICIRYYRLNDKIKDPFVILHLF